MERYERQQGPFLEIDYPEKRKTNLVLIDGYVASSHDDESDAIYAGELYVKRFPGAVVSIQFGVPKKFGNFEKRGK